MGTGEVEVRGRLSGCEGTEKSEDRDERQIRFALYTILILRSHDYLLVFIRFPIFPYPSFLGLSGAVQLCHSIPERSGIRVKG